MSIYEVSPLLPEPSAPSLSELQTPKQTVFGEVSTAALEELVTNLNKAFGGDRTKKNSFVSKHLDIYNLDSRLEFSQALHQKVTSLDQNGLIKLIMGYWDETQLRSIDVLKDWMEKHSVLPELKNYLEKNRNIQICTARDKDRIREELKASITSRKTSLQKRNLISLNRSEDVYTVSNLDKELNTLTFELGKAFEQFYQLEKNKGEAHKFLVTYTKADLNNISSSLFLALAESAHARITSQGNKAIANLACGFLFEGLTAPLRILITWFEQYQLLPELRTLILENQSQNFNDLEDRSFFLKQALIFSGYPEV